MLSMWISIYPCIWTYPNMDILCRYLAWISLQISMRCPWHIQCYPCGSWHIQTLISCVDIYLDNIWYVDMWICLGYPLKKRIIWDIYGYHWIYILDIIGYICLDKSLHIIGYVVWISMDISHWFLDCRRPLPLWAGLGGGCQISTLGIRSLIILSGANVADLRVWNGIFSFQTGSFDGTIVRPPGPSRDSQVEGLLYDERWGGPAHPLLCRRPTGRTTSSQKWARSRLFAQTGNFDWP